MQQLSIVNGDYKPEFLLKENLIDIFKNTVSRHHDKTALIFNEASITYRHLDLFSDSVAYKLQSAGVGHGDVCIVWWPRSIELHVAILAILKCGATYVPIDFEMPEERVVAVMEDIHQKVLFTPNNFSKPCTVINEITFNGVGASLYKTVQLQPEDDAYILFTSGSTGKPKGIPISQRNICSFVRSENDLLGIKNTDKVYQGISVSFDMWCEETWISYLVGATLWIADVITSKSIDELSNILGKEKITVLHTVPSLLAVMEAADLPLLRLINAGGEACTTQVLNKWAVGDRLFFNTYGPTETTVSASAALLKKGDKITIGKPLPNYALAVVNENMQPLPIGEQGELIISGSGVGHGYINLDKLTKEKFIQKNRPLAKMPGEIIYRTGDAVYMDENMDVHFVGRIDDQIKLRGYRIELGEIETLLNDFEGVQQAAIALKKDSNNEDQLTGFVVMQRNLALNESLVKEKLSQKLPDYMIPLSIIILDELPRLSSGKIDRKKLPTPESYLKQVPTFETDIHFTDTTEQKVIKLLSNIFAKADIQISQDFFNDLGGHSLLAASFVSKMRKEGGIKNASLKDIYLNRPLSALITKWDNIESVENKKTKEPFKKIPALRYYLCGLAQSISLLLIYGLLALQIFIPYLAYYFMQLEYENHLKSILISIVTFCVLPPLFTGFGIAAKWIIIGKYKEGEYPLWGTYFFRWWLVKSIQKLIPTQFLNGTPLFATYLKWMGAKVASDAQLSAFTIGAVDLLFINEDVSISSSVVINNAVVENGMLKISKVIVGKHAYIGTSAVVGGNTEIKDWGELQDLSFLQAGKTINYAEVFAGSPAKLSFTRTEKEFTQPLPISAKRRRQFSTVFSLMLILFPFFILLPLIPTIITLAELDSNASPYDFNYIIYTPILSIIYILLFVLESIFISRILQKDLKAGSYPIYSKFYIRKWLVDQMNSLSLIVLHPIFATVYVSTYFRALGAKIGKNTEISTASSVTHGLLDIGSGSFIADAVTLGEADVRGQKLVLDNTKIGNNSFVGNSALIPQGYTLGSNMLIGVLSVPPNNEQIKNVESIDWFGSPAIALPKRQASDFDATLTLNPSKKLLIARYFVEFIRIVLPQTIILISSIFFIAYTSDLLSDESLFSIIIKTPFYYLAFMGLPLFLITVILKWTIVGKYKAAKYPMWNYKVWFSEFITSTYEALVVPFFFEYLIGTPWLPFFLKFFGVKTGKRIFLNTTDITEFDMVIIGDDVAMNAECGPQTHLFEDRVMKIGAIKFGDRVTLGSRAIVLYDSEIGNDVTIDPLSLIMKGEAIPANTQWGGSPVSEV